MAGARVFTLNLLESFRLTSPDGARIDVVSKKGMALLAMLAMAAEGERTRAWLQDRLWGTRERRPGAEQPPPRALQSAQVPQRKLRAAGAGLRAPLGKAGPHAVRHRRQASGTGPSPPLAEFLEGFDIAGEEGFEEWLREQRRLMASRSADAVEAKRAQAPAPKPGNRQARSSTSRYRPPASTTGRRWPSCPSPISPATRSTTISARA